MKRCPLSIPFLILFACGGNETHTGDIAYAELKIQVDTVLVDSGEEILMAATRGFGLAISADGKMLYNWDPESSQVEFVDLESMKLLKKQRFEKEGPNGVGTNAHVMRIHPNNQLAFIGWDNAISIADLEGNVSQKIKLNEPWMVEGLEEKGSLSLLAFSEDGIKAYCSLINFKMLSADIVELDIENKQRRILQLPEFEKLDKFRIAWSSADGRGMSMWHPNLSAIPWRGKMLFWTNAMAGVYRFDPAMDSLEWRQYNSLLTANEKTGTYKNDVSEAGELRQEVSKIQEEVSFTKMLWDDKNNVFYRFTYFNLPKVADEKTKIRSFVSVLSQDLELLGEREITDFGFTTPNPQYAKDGKVYLFLNLDDELAFVRLMIN